MAKISLPAFTFGDVIIRQSQNTARLSFEIQFQAVKRRLDIQTNEKKETYNNLDTTLEPALAGLRRKSSALKDEKENLDTFMEKTTRNVNKLTGVLNLYPKLYDAASSVAPTAEADFNFARNQLNKALKTVQASSSDLLGLKDATQSIRNSQNPSGIKDYASYANDGLRELAVGSYASAGSDLMGVNLGASFGAAEKTALVRQQMVLDIAVAKSKIGTQTPVLDRNGKPVLDREGKPIMKDRTGLIKQIHEVDAEIDRKITNEKLVVLKEVQAMEKKNDTFLRGLSLNFEFSQANLQNIASASRGFRPEKGSILNIFS